MIQELDILRQRVAVLDKSELAHTKAEALTEEKQKLNEMLLSSLPHPAMLIRGKDKVILAANRIALDFGVKIGGQCWREFGKTAYISQKDKEIIEKYPDIVPTELGVKCTFCQGDECFSEAPKQNNPEVHAFDKIWDTYWIRVSDVIYLHYAIDISERKQAEEALRQRSLELQQLTEALEQRVLQRTAELATTNEALRHLSTKLLSTQEDERKRIAGDLHDTIGSCLNAIKFKVETVQEQIGNTANVTSDVLNTIIPIVQECIGECRRIQMDLRPSMLDDLGLLPTLSWFCRRFQTIYSEIRIEQEIEIKEGDMPPPLKIVVFRVIQETMNNTAKHSHANLMRLSLRKLNDRMELVLQDNGQGFNLEKARSKKTTKRGLGLTSMRERTELSGGSFNIESTEGKGTIIRASWPIEQLSL